MYLEPKTSNQTVCWQIDNLCQSKWLHFGRFLTILHLVQYSSKVVVVDTLWLALFQEFKKSYIDNFLWQFLNEPLIVVVNCTTSLKTCYAQMSYTKSGKSMIQIGWYDTMEKHNLKVNDLYIFTFKDERNTTFRNPHTWLRLVIQIVEEWLAYYPLDALMQYIWTVWWSW
jgi:hypothetical protein